MILWVFKLVNYANSVIIRSNIIQILGKTMRNTMRLFGIKSARNYVKTAVASATSAAGAWYLGHETGKEAGKEQFLSDLQDTGGKAAGAVNEAVNHLSVEAGAALAVRFHNKKNTGMVGETWVDRLPRVEGEEGPRNLQVSHYTRAATGVVSYILAVDADGTAKLLLVNDIHKNPADRNSGKPPVGCYVPPEGFGNHPMLPTMDGKSPAQESLPAGAIDDCFRALFKPGTNLSRVWARSEKQHIAGAYAAESGDYGWADTSAHETLQEGGLDVSNYPLIPFSWHENSIAKKPNGTCLVQYVMNAVRVVPASMIPADQQTNATDEVKSTANGEALAWVEVENMEAFAEEHVVRPSVITDIKLLLKNKEVQEAIATVAAEQQQVEVTTPRI